MGHERGAFTGAMALKKGRFELADGGTIFLDEVGELPLPLQAKLLRVLQERQFERLGGTTTITVDVRIISATNRSLEKAVEEKSFREDLFYRLNVVPIILPPLRERAEDIPVLLDHFLRESNKVHKGKVRLARPVIDFLIDYAWPGNVRELQNLIERLVIMAEGGVLGMSELPSYMTSPPEPAAIDQQREYDSSLPRQGGAPDNRAMTSSLEAMERREVEAALVRHGWVQSRAARELGLTQRQIGYKIKKLGLIPPDYLT